MGMSGAMLTYGKMAREEVDQLATNPDRKKNPAGDSPGRVLLISAAPAVRRFRPTALFFFGFL